MIYDEIRLLLVLANLIHYIFLHLFRNQPRIIKSENFNQLVCVFRILPWVHILDVNWNSPIGQLHYASHTRFSLSVKYIGDNTCQLMYCSIENIFRFTKCQRCDTAQKIKKPWKLLLRIDNIVYVKKIKTVSMRIVCINGWNESIL